MAALSSFSRCSTLFASGTVEPELATARLEAELATTRAEAWAARCEARDLKDALSKAHEKIEMLERKMGSDSNTEGATDDKGTDDAALFDAIDDNGDGVLSREEFTKGYAIFLADVASQSFDAIDADGSGSIDREEFKKGFALLTSDSARAAAEREKVEAAVAQARIEATKEAALLLAQAELMDVLNSPASAAAAATTAQPRKGRGRARGGGPTAPPLRKWGPESNAAYTQYGPVPDGFDTDRVEALIAERCAAKAAGEYAKADQLQEALILMGVRLDDRWRTWSSLAALEAPSAPRSASKADDAAQAGQVVSTKTSAGRPSGRGRGGRGRGRGRGRGPKRISEGERKWREGARPARFRAAAKSAVESASAAPPA